MQALLLTAVLFIFNPLQGISAEKFNFRRHGPDSTYFGNAVVSYTIKGKKTTIKNLLQTGGQNITALHLNVVGLIPKKNLVRVNFTNSLTHEVFDFIVADKGTTVIQHYKPTLTVEEEKKAVYMSTSLVNFYADNVRVEISIADEKHVTGKFSGEFISDNGTHVVIKAGSFDIPITVK
ncbi:MAG TPA: hypothetical protein VGH64_15190 [Puia sp.]|jgi:hypothetical protein